MEITVENEPRMTADGAELLREVKTYLREEPRRLRMTTWLRKTILPPGSVIPGNDAGWGEEDFEVPACGTVGCIAGWMAKLRARPEKANVSGAKEFLGLPYRTCRDLCMVTEWPVDLAEMYYAARNTPNPQETRVEVVCERIDRFLAEYGPEVPLETT